MNTKILLITLTFLFALIIAGSASAADWTVGPGGTYDYTTIQSAINSGTTVPGDTITVYDDAGNPYTYQENVIVNKDLSVTTTGQVTVDGSLTPTSPVFTVNSAGSLSTISGFTLTGATNSAGVLINGATDVNLNDLTINNCQRGVVVQGTTSNININGATITGTTSNGIYIESGTHTNLSILNSVISGTGSTGITKYTLSNVDGLNILNTSISNPTGYGISLYDNSPSSYLKNVVIDNVTVSGATSDGIRISLWNTSSENFTITDSTISNCYQHGIYLQTRGVLLLSGNTFTHNGYAGGSGSDGSFYGLYLVGDYNSSIAISGNAFNSNRNGVFLQNVGQESSPVVFDGSLFVDNAGYPFYISSGRYITIQGGTFNDTTTQANTGSRIQRAFNLAGTNNNITIDGATISGTTSQAIYIDGGTTTNLTIQNCVISGTGSQSISKYQYSNLDGLNILNTSISNPTGFGIYLYDNAPSSYLKNVVIDNSTVTGTTVDGIRINMWNTSSENVTITDSTVSNCYQHGIYLSTRGTLTLQNNTLTHNGYNGGSGSDGSFYGLYLVGDYNSSIAISGNAFNLNRNGVFLQNVGQESSPVVFDGSLFVDNAGYPFYINGGRYITIQGGTFNDTTTQANTGSRIQRAFNLAGTNTNITITGSTINNTAQQAIYIETGTTTNLTVQDTVITGTGANSIAKYLYSNIDGLNILNTSISNPTGFGIYLYDNAPSSYLKNVVINNSTITGATNDGIRIFMGDTNSGNVTITNTTISNNTQNGIYLQARGTINVKDNNISNNPGSGIWLNSSSSLIYGNNFVSNGIGLNIYTGSGNNVLNNNFISNTTQAMDSGSSNLFYDDKPVGGNYWSDYTGVDVDRDGFGDTPYTITGITDNYPYIGTIIHVYPGESIQSAINSSLAGYVIIVHGDNGNPATYTENLTVDKQLVIKTIDDGTVTVQAATTSLPCFTINNLGSLSTINGFTITGATGSVGVLIDGAINVNLTDLTINNCQRGVYIVGSASNILLDDVDVDTTGQEGILVGSDGSYITNVTIQNCDLSNTGSHSIYKYDYSTLIGISVLNSTVTNSQGAGIAFSDINPNYILQNVVIDQVNVNSVVMDGIYVYMGNRPESQNVTVTNVNVNGAGYEGIDLFLRGTVVLTDNSVQNSASWGVQMTGYDNPAVTFQNNTVQNNANGLYLRDINGLTISDTNNNIHDNGGTNYQLENADNTTIENMSFNNAVVAYNYAVYANNCDDLTLRNLDISDSGQQSILLTGTGANILINQIDITRPGQQGIYFTSGNLSDIVISNCEIMDCGAQGIYFTGGTLSGIVVSDCLIVDCGASGIEKDYWGAIDGITIENTVITNPNNSGIALNGFDSFVNHIVIDNNIITSVGDDGVHIRMDSGSCHDVQVTNNTITGSGGSGVTLYGRGVIVVSGNVVQNNSNWGVWMRGFDNPTVTFNNNQITNNGNGLYLQSVNGGNFQDNQLINNTGDDLYATSDTSNTFTRLTVGLAHPTVVTFDYVNGIVVNGVESPPADISGLLNIGKYVDLQGLGSTSVNLKVYYSPADIVGLNEASLKIFHYTTGWSVLSPPNGVNTTERYVYADGITSFSVFAAMGGPADMVYVDGVGGSEANDGFTPLTAKLTINSGIDVALNNWTVNIYPNTTYSEDVLINKDITLQPYGVGNVALNGSVTINSDGSGSTIQGFMVTGSGGSNGITLNSANNCQIMGNTISNGFIGVYMQNSNSNTLSGNSVLNNGWVGVCIDNSSGNTVDGGNVITGNVEGVLIANTSTGNTITGNNIHTNSDTGITILDNPTSNTISDNTAISGNGVIGVLIRNADTNNVSGNTIQNNGWAGIALDNADGNIVNGSNNISGNQEGLNLTNSDGNTVTANNIFDNVNIGLSVINGSTDNFITDNSAISDNGIIGLYFRNSGSNTVSGNVVQINGWVGMCLDNASGNTINGSNDVAGNMEGLYIVNNSNNNTITANNIHENADTGVYIDGSTGNNITGNTAISGNGVIGVLFRNADGNTISGNTLSGNSFAGIALDSADSNIINGANLVSGSSMGLYVTNNSSSNTINNNTLQNNTWAGLVLDFAINTTVYQNNFVNNPLQALAQNGTGNAFYQGTTGNYWSDCTTTDPRSIAGNEGLYDQYPSLTPF